MRFLKPAQKTQQTKKNNTGKRMPSGPAPSFTKTVYACGDGTPGNDKCFKMTKLIRGPLPRIK